MGGHVSCNRVSWKEWQPTPFRWMPAASELKPALDVLQEETGLLPELNGLIADFADVLLPHWRPSGHDADSGHSPVAELPRRFRVRVVVPTDPVVVRRVRCPYLVMGGEKESLQNVLSIDPHSGLCSMGRAEGWWELTADLTFDMEISPTGPESGALTMRVNSRDTAQVVQMDCAHLARLCSRCPPTCFSCCTHEGLGPRCDPIRLCVCVVF
jgi:hypothetical protein